MIYLIAAVIEPGGFPVSAFVAAFVICLCGAVYFGAQLLRGKK